jgi:two-component system LytT family response regulator
MVIQALIADDEMLARQKLRDLLTIDPEIEIVGEAASGPEAVRLAREKGPQLIFLDVAMPSLDGFGVLDELSSQESAYPMPRVVFTTAYDRYALRAFDAQAVDYLLKPFTPERLRVAVRRVREELASPSHDDSNHSKGEGSSPYLTRIIHRSRGRILFLRIAEILWIGAEENYIRIATAKDSYLLRAMISSMEEKLDPAMFVRVHRSAIVNLRFVKEIRAQTRGDFEVVLTNGHRVAMSRGYYARIRSLLKAS